METLLSVTIVGLDRNRRWMAVEPNRRFPDILDELHANGIVDLEQDLILDPVLLWRSWRDSRPGNSCSQ